jgi:hypothetical protein
VVENIDGMNDRIETNFSEIRDLLQDYKNDMLSGDTKKNEREIAELKNELKSKDNLINDLKQ